MKQSSNFIIANSLVKVVVICLTQFKYSDFRKIRVFENRIQYKHLLQISMAITKMTSLVSLISIGLVITSCSYKMQSKNTTSIYVVPHPDDWLLFMNPNASYSI